MASRFLVAYLCSGHWWYFASSDSNSATATRPGFQLSVPDRLQSTLFSSAHQKGWLGGDQTSSFRLNSTHYVWMFGDSYVDATAASLASGGKAGEVALCNWFPARSCAMPTQTFALWDSQASEPADMALKFYWKLDPVTAEPTSTFWPPTGPACNGCSQWRAPTLLNRTAEMCEDAVLPALGSCCKTDPAGQCPGYCCHRSFYFWPMAGMASADGRLLIMADYVQDSAVFPDLGWCMGTYAVSVTNAGDAVSPAEWKYRTERMPGTTTHCNGPEALHFFTALANARAPSQPELVYLMGLANGSSVMARANISDLLDFKWKNIQFWSAREEDGIGMWTGYTAEGNIPTPLPIMSYKLQSNTEATLYFDEFLDKWVIPDVSQQGMMRILVSNEVTGPYEAWELGSVPSTVVPQVEKWTVRAIKNHPELTSEDCQMVSKQRHVLMWYDCCSTCSC